MLDPELARWAVDSLAPGGVLRSAVGLRAGAAPWLVTAERLDGREVDAVLRVGPADDIAIETASLQFVHTQGVAVPKVIAVRTTPTPALLLIERIRGSSSVPLVCDPARLHALGAFAATLAGLSPPAGFVPRSRSVVGVDFAQLRREATPQPLLQRAEAFVASVVPQSRTGMVHGDLWQGNTLWRSGRIVGVIDWDCSGVGPAGIDLGSLRIDAAMAYGQSGADAVLSGWEDVGGPAPDLDYWDAVAALCTPPEIDWFGDAVREQGRPDLTQEILRDRRDTFLERALGNQTTQFEP